MAGQCVLRLRDKIKNNKHTREQSSERLRGYSNQWMRCRWDNCDKDAQVMGVKWSKDIWWKGGGSTLKSTKTKSDPDMKSLNMSVWEDESSWGHLGTLFVGAKMPPFFPTGPLPCPSNCPRPPSWAQRVWLSGESGQPSVSSDFPAETFG